VIRLTQILAILGVVSFQLEPVPIAKPRASNVIIMTVKLRGNTAPLSGDWVWTTENRARGGSKVVKLEVRIKDSKVTGTLIDPFELLTTDGTRSNRTIFDGEVSGPRSFIFTRCQGMGMYSEGDEEYTGRLHQTMMFKKCAKDKSGSFKAHQTIYEYVGVITGDDLMLNYIIRNIP
jgi:hypothetical protein